jgi:hypothetical protein
MTTTTQTQAHGTWIAQGQPQAFTYWGRKGSGPAAEGTEVAQVTRVKNHLTLVAADGSTIEQVGVTAKLWISQGTSEAEQAAEGTALAAEGQDTTGLEVIEQANAGAEAVTDEAAAAAAWLATQPVRATWKGHGNPQEFAYLGTNTASPAADEAQQVVKVETGPGGRITMTTSTGATISSVSNATKFWAIVPAAAASPDQAPAKAKAPRQAKAPTGKRAEAIAAVTASGKVPAGYEPVWPHGAYCLIRATSSAPEGSATWLVLCTAHGTTTQADNARDGDTKGTKANRQSWCKPCKAAAAKAAAASEPTAEHDSAAASS